MKLSPKNFFRLPRAGDTLRDNGPSESSAAALASAPLTTTMTTASTVHVLRLVVDVR